MPSNRKHTHGIAPLAIAATGTAALAGVLYVEGMTTVIARRRSHLLNLVSKRFPEKPTPHVEAARAGSAHIRTVPMESVTIRNREGLRLRGHWYPATYPTRICIMVHGWHGSWHDDFGAAAPFYHDRGCSLLFIEQRCHGESEGKLISYGIKERFDVLDWLEWVETNHPGLPVYLCGLSMGAATVLMTTELPISHRIRGVIADCGYTEPREIIRETVSKTLGRATSATVYAVDLNCRLRGKWSMRDCTPLSALKNNTEIPVLFIHGDADLFVPCRMSLENYIACQAPRDLLVVPGAAHGLAYVANPDMYEAKVCAFFDKYD